MYLFLKKCEAPGKGRVAQSSLLFCFDNSFKNNEQLSDFEMVFISAIKLVVIKLLYVMWKKKLKDAAFF